MKSPFDKISAGGNRIFQIIATHRCNLRCTNCTQGQGYVQYDMSVDVFRDCCRGLSDWPGIVGLFGRLPLLHPQIRELLAIIREEIKDPVHRGLWINDIPDKSLVPELQATFTLASTFNLNAHGIPEAFGRMNECFPGRVISDSGHQRAWHSPVRVAIQDFVGTDQLPDEATMWAMSASVTLSVLSCAARLSAHSCSSRCFSSRSFSSRSRIAAAFSNS